MAAKLKSTSDRAAAKPKGKTAEAPPLTLEEHAHRIEILAKRIEGYVKFMCQNIANSGMSSEVKTRAVIAFYEKLVVAEQQLARIHDELRLE